MIPPVQVVTLRRVLCYAVMKVVYGSEFRKYISKILNHPHIQSKHAYLSRSDQSLQLLKIHFCCWNPEFRTSLENFYYWLCYLPCTWITLEHSSKEHIGKMYHGSAYALLWCVVKPVNNKSNGVSQQYPTLSWQTLTGLIPTLTGFYITEMRINGEWRYLSNNCKQTIQVCG